MPAADKPEPIASEPGGVMGSLNAASLLVAVGFATTAAVLFMPIFVISFPVLLGRMLFLAMVLLLTFVYSQRMPERWLPRWLPRWLFTTLAVALAGPLATFGIYLASVGGDLHAFLRSEPRITGFVLLASAALVLGLIVTLSAQVREREARARSQALQFELERSRLERQALDARLALLSAQIEPHFLFNTLANVQALVESGSPRAAPVLQSLIAYLRAAVPDLHGGAAHATLGRELRLVEAYLELMRMRMPDRLAFTIAADPALAGERFPAMALLTLAENAVRHGIDPAEDGGHVDVRTWRDPDGALHAAVTDTGVGFGSAAAGGSSGTGLANLRERLAGLFGNKAELRLEEHPPHGVRADIVVRP